MIWLWGDRKQASESGLHAGVWSWAMADGFFTSPRQPGKHLSLPRSLTSQGNREGGNAGNTRTGTQEVVGISPCPSNPETPQRTFMCSKHTCTHTATGLILWSAAGHRRPDWPNPYIIWGSGSTALWWNTSAVWMLPFLQNMGGHTSILQLWKACECGQYGAERMVSITGVSQETCVF